MADITKKKYVDSAALQHLLEKLRDKNKELFLGKMAEAASAAKVNHALTLTVGENDVVFDGSEVKSAAVAAKVHKHTHADISDFDAAVKKAAFGDEHATMTAHTHDNKAVLDTVSADRVAKWDAKISVDDVARIKYENTGMTSVKDVKGALDVLVANVQIAAGQLTETSRNMDAVKKVADDAAKAAAAEKTRAEGKEGELKTAIDAINNTKTGILKQAKDYADGKDAAIAAAKKAGDDAQKDVNALEGKVGEVPADKTVIGLIGEAKAQADKGVADAAAEATRAKGVEAGLRTDLGTKEAAADANGSAFARIAKVKADLASEAATARAAEQANAAAAKAAQDDVDALEVKVGKADDTKDKATVYGAIAAEKVRAEGKEGEIKAIADKNKTDIATLNGADTVEGSVAKKIKDAIDKVNTAAAGLGGRVDTLEGKVGSAGDAAKADGSLYARVAKNAADIDAIEADYLKSTDKTDLQNAIKTERDRIDAFYASAEVGDKAVDTLKEIQSYITSDGTAAAQMTKDIAANKTAIDAINNKTTGILAQAKADAQSKDEALHTTITGEIATAKQGAIDAAASAADTKVGAAKTELQGKINKKADATALQAEIERAKGAEAANKAVLDKLDGGVNVDGSVKKQIETAKTALQANIDTKVAQEAYNTKVAALEAADTKLSERIAKFEGDGAGSVAAQVKAVADDLDAHKKAQVTKEKQVDDKLAIIQGEANVEGSIKKALADAKAYADAEDKKIEDLLGTKKDAATVDTAFGRIAKEVARATEAEGALDGRLDTAEGKITALETTVGNAQSGLVKDVADLKSINADTRLTAAETSITNLEAWVAAHGTITNDELDAMLDKVYNQA